MREILFRGKRVDDGKWIFGSFCMDALEQYNGLCGVDGFIRLYDKEKGKMQSYEVERDTVGQFTGLLDKNGKRIFEGDLFRDESEDLTAVVIFKDGCFRLEWHGMTGAWTESGFDECGGGYGITECESVDYWYVHDMEVIGNIHDNQGLENRKESVK